MFGVGSRSARGPKLISIQRFQSKLYRPPVGTFRSQSSFIPTFVVSPVYAQLDRGCCQTGSGGEAKFDMSLLVPGFVLDGVPCTQSWLGRCVLDVNAEVFHRLDMETSFR